MVPWVLCIAALCSTGALADLINKIDMLNNKVLQDRQLEFLKLMDHLLEPSLDKKFEDIAFSWNLEENIDQYRNVTAVSQYAIMIKNKWILRRMVPYAVYDPVHNMETVIAFNVLYSAKTYNTFINTAAYLREIINVGLFTYVASVAIQFRGDTQGITIPPIYNTVPNYFVSPDIIFTGMFIDVQGKEFVEKYEGYKNLTFVKDGVVYIKGDAYLGAYNKNKLNDISYFTHDYSLNALHYYYSLNNPYWLSYDVLVSLNKGIRRGEMWLYNLRQLVTRYEMERLCNGLGEIPALSDKITEGYTTDLMYLNGIPFPSRPDHFNLNHNKLADKLEAAKEYERRIWEAIDKGLYYTPSGKLESLRNEDGADLLGRLIQAYADSPNSYLYKDFFQLYASVIGNTDYDSIELDDGFPPIVVPSAIENYQTALRDPAFYIIAKRILNLVKYWNKDMKPYTPEDLSVSGVKIIKVETNKLVTFMEKKYLNLSNALPMTPNERKKGFDTKAVATTYVRLNHKSFSINLTVVSQSKNTVRTKFFLSPKYNNVDINFSIRNMTQNYFQFDEFTYDLKIGENIITRNSDESEWTTKDLLNSAEIYEQIASGKWMPEISQNNFRFPQNLLFPKGTINGMTFQLMVFIDDYPLKNSSLNSTFLGLGTGGRNITDKPYGYPTNRPLFKWQLENVKNIYFQDVIIYNDPTPA